MKKSEARHSIFGLKTIMLNTVSPLLKSIRDKVEAGERLSFEASV